MIPSFLLHQPHSLEEACALLTRYGAESKILAGGSELSLLLKLGLAYPRHIIDIKGIRELNHLDFDRATQTLHVGALVTHRAVELSDTVYEHFPLLVEMERQLANVRIRNVGTLAGNLCFAEPHADPGTLLLAYEAKVSLHASSGYRVLTLSDFFIDYYKTAIQEDEILTGIQVPKPGENFSGAYLRFCPGERPIVAVAVLIGWKGRIANDVRLSLGCVGPMPVRARDLEEKLAGRSVSDILANSADAGDSAARLCDPLDDIWGSVEYKRQLVRVFVMRALSKLTEQITREEK